VDKVIKDVKDLKVYNLSYKLAMEIFNITKNFPKEETYSLTINSKNSTNTMNAMNSTWLDSGLDCKYVLEKKHRELDNQYKEVGAMLYTLMNNWRTF